MRKFHGLRKDGQAWPRLVVRRRRPEDDDAATRLIIGAFPSTDGGPSEVAALECLRTASGSAVAFVGVEDGSVVGHVALSPVEVSGQSSGWFGVGPIAVAEQLTKSATAIALIEHALLELDQGGARGCVVLGEEGFYSRFGFVPDHGLILTGIPNNRFLALTFDGSAQAPGRQLAVY